MEQIRNVYAEEFKPAVMKIDIVGDTPLIMHRWKERPEGLPYDVPMKTNPIMDYVDSLYWLDYNDRLAEEPFVADYKGREEEQHEYDRIQSLAKAARFGFPAAVLKSRVIDTAFRKGLIDKRTSILGALRIPDEFIVIKGTPEIRADRLRVPNNSKTWLRYGAMFRAWSSEVTVQYNPEIITAEEIADLMNLYGAEGGIGSWTPAKGGTMGKFHVQQIIA